MERLRFVGTTFSRCTTEAPGYKTAQSATQAVETMRLADEATTETKGDDFRTIIVAGLSMCTAM